MFSKLVERKAHREMVAHKKKEKKTCGERISEQEE